MNENVLAKLKILAESAKYDVSCSSSGTVRRNSPGTLGNTVGGWGICHSFAEDGRCISLLKIMLTNYCIYDCAYCINRRSNDIPRATLSVSELVDLTIEFYRRNYIEGRSAESRLYDGTPRAGCQRPATHTPVQRLHPSEKHSRRQSRAGKRGGTLCRPSERKHRDT